MSCSPRSAMRRWIQPQQTCWRRRKYKSYRTYTTYTSAQRRSEQQLPLLRRLGRNPEKNRVALEPFIEFLSVIVAVVGILDLIVKRQRPGALPVARPPTAPGHDVIRDFLARPGAWLEL